MNTEASHSEDEFFGNQSDSEDDYLHNPHFDESDASPSTSQKHGHHRHGHGALNEHERNSQRETRRNVGYHEAYDEYKEVKLQQGFESGYREHIDHAMKLGILLGKHVVGGSFNFGQESSQSQDQENTENTKYGDEEVRIKDGVGIVRKYLEEAQSTDRNDARGISGGRDEIQSVIERLERKTNGSK